MAIAPIWKQLLTFVSYGNDYLKHGLALSEFRNHSIFFQHTCQFRDLKQQHLLAQHFTVWLEGLKRQGCTQLSLHSAELLLNEANPNPNVELLAYSHFIVSHHADQRYAWICGQELAEWYQYDNPIELPLSQKSSLTHSVLWRYALTVGLNKAIDEDLATANWADIQHFLDERIFHHALAQDLVIPMAGTPYMGIEKARLLETDGQWKTDVHYLPVLSHRYIADLAHQLLYQFDALEEHLYELKQQQAQNTETSEEDRITLRNFSQTVEELHIRCLTKIANHHDTAQLSQLIAPSTTQTEYRAAQTPSTVGAKQVAGLIGLVLIICLLGYYFGL